MASPNVISIPFRRGVHLELSGTIRQYISVKYDQHPDMFRQDLEVIDALRKDAVNVREPHPSGIQKLQAYAAQLMCMGGKFPIDIGADFTWYPALGYNLDRPTIHNNLKYELLSVLFNLAALYSQLAISSARSTTDGLKTAANYFTLAAGVLQHAARKVVPDLRMSDPPEDMCPHTLEALAQLSLAQAQECYWQKAVVSEMRDGVISRLAARASDLYSAAGEEAVKSDAISSAWIHHMGAKHHHFAAAAQYRAARDCLERGKFGEEVARLMDAVNCVAAGIQDTRRGCLNKTVVEDLNGLKRKVEEDLKRAEKDNDMIYLNPVPPKTELKPLDRAIVVKPQIPPQVLKPGDYVGVSASDKAEFGVGLFARLVPFSVHQATSIYEERRDRLANQSIIQKLEGLTDEVHSALASLGLPGSLQALEKPLGLPHSLTQHADELRRAEALTRITKSFADIDKLRAGDMEVYHEGLEILASEEEEDRRLRAKHGTARWSRPTSDADPQGAALREQAREIEGYFATSLSSDGLVREKFAAVRDTLALLAGPERKLMAAVPSSTQATIPENLKAVIGRLRGAYNDVLRLESRRRKRIEALREKCRADDIRADILREAARLERAYPSTTVVPEHFEDFFERRLDRLYETEMAGVEKEAAEQGRLLGEVARVDREFEAQKRTGEGAASTRMREGKLQELEEAYTRYGEIVGNLEAGRKFYNDLSRIVGQIFRDQARAWANQRRMEARSLEDELSLPPLSTLSLSRTTPAHSPAATAYNPASESYFSSPPQAPAQTVYSPAATTYNPASESYFSSPPQAPTQMAYHHHQQQQQQQPGAEAGHFPPASEPAPAPAPPQTQSQTKGGDHAAPYQSWANETVPTQQPRPVAPMQGMWTPDAGIKFAPRGTSPVKGTWDPGAGIKFG